MGWLDNGHRPGSYYRYDNASGLEFRSPDDYLRHCRAAAASKGHGSHPNCPDIMECPWVNLNVAKSEREFEIRRAVWEIFKERKGAE